MNQHSENELLEAQIRECYGRVVWTHKTQEKCSDILAKRNSRIKLAQIVLSALTTTGIFIFVFGDKNWVGILLIKVIKREKKTANSMDPIMLTVILLKMVSVLHGKGLMYQFQQKVLIDKSEGTSSQVLVGPN